LVRVVAINMFVPPALAIFFKDKQGIR